MEVMFLLLNMSFADSSVIRKIAVNNGFEPNSKVVESISRASKAYNIPVDKMTAIAIVETGLGRYNKNNLNKNGTVDKGLFQINTVNNEFCSEFNLQTNEGSAFCAAKLLNKLRKTHPNEYVYVYHSKTPSKKLIYKQKIDKVLLTGNTK